MTSLSYKNIMKEVEARLNEISKTEIEKLIMHWAGKEEMVLLTINTVKVITRLRTCW